MKRFDVWTAVIGACMCSGFAKAQLTTHETLQECSISPEVLAASGCVSSDAALIVSEIEGDIQWRLLLETLQESLINARSSKQALLEQLTSVDSAEDFDRIQTDIQAAAHAESLAMNAYQDEVNNVVAKISAVLTSPQEVSLALILRKQVSMLPPEYRVLNWTDRKLKKLARALKTDDSDQHPLLLEANAIYEVQLARQNLLHQRDLIAAAIEIDS